MRRVKALVRALFDRSGDGMPSMVMLTPEGQVPVRQTELAPEGLDFSEDVSEARWIEESLAQGQWGVWTR